MADKTMPGWFVVVKKEARGRRINPADEDHPLGQEASKEDMQVFGNTGSQRAGREEGVGSDEECEARGNQRRRRSADER